MNNEEVQARIAEIARWSRPQASLVDTALKNGLSTGEDEHTRQLRADIDLLLSLVTTPTADEIYEDAVITALEQRCERDTPWDAHSAGCARTLLRFQEWSGLRDR